MSETNVFTDALARLERISKEVGASSEVSDVLMHPRATLTASLPVRME